MSEKDTAKELRDSWRELIADHRAEPLTGFMSKHSGLPGPRGNITLAAEASRLIAEDWGVEGGFLHSLIEGWASSSDEYLTFTAHMALGYILAENSAEESWVVPILYRGNLSKLWRAREGVTFALEALLDKRRSFTLALIDKWCTGGNPIVVRNSIVALAHPSQLRESTEQLDALKKYNRVGMELVAGSLKKPNLDVLAKSLGFTLSVAAEADEGYLDQFGEWIGADVKLWKSIIKENLRKARIVKKYPERVAALRVRLG